MAVAVVAAAAVAIAIDQSRRRQTPVRRTVARAPRPAPAAAPEAQGAAATPATPVEPTAAPKPATTAKPKPRAKAEPKTGTTLDFYNARSRSSVPVPTDKVRKRRVVRTGDNGSRQERYAAVAEIEVEGRELRLFKFISRDQFDTLDVPEES